MGINYKFLKKRPEYYVKRLKIKQLVEVLTKADHYYYNTGRLILDDDTYDYVKDELRERNPKHPKLKDVGSLVKHVKNKVKLPYYMGSIDKLEGSAIDRWTVKYKNSYMISDKLDGISLELVGHKDYWKLYTRGNGKIGQDITYLSPFLKLPKPINGIAVRAEMIMAEGKFKRFFKKVAENPRSFVSGLVNRKTVNVKGTKKIDVIAYGIMGKSLSPESRMKKLKSIGFVVAPYQIVENLTLLESQLKKRRSASKYELDGLVVEHNAKHRVPTSGNPKHAFKYKITDKSQITSAVVKKVQWNLSKDGYLKPRIFVESVRIGGVTVKHLTGFNAKYITENGIGPKTELKIIRSGDVIPHIHEVVKSTTAQLPNRKYEWTDSGVDIYILDHTKNEDVIVKKNTRFFRSIGVEAFSDKRVILLFNAGYRTIPSIINITITELLEIPGIQDKLANTIKNNIKSALSEIELPLLMDASGVFDRNIGYERLSWVCKRYPNLLKIKPSLLYEKVLLINGFSDITAMSFKRGMPKFRKFMRSMPKINIVMPKALKIVSDKLKGIAVVFSGFRNQALEDEIIKYGGTVKKGVSKNINVLIVKDKSAISGKITKAEELNIEILNVSEFRGKYL